MGEDILDFPLSKEEYDKIPLLYCADCFSLRILSVDDIDYCEECGGTSIKEGNIEEWEKLYESHYGHKYIDKKKNNGKEVRS